MAPPAIRPTVRQAVPLAIELPIRHPARRNRRTKTHERSDRGGATSAVGCGGVALDRCRTAARPVGRPRDRYRRTVLSIGAQRSVGDGRRHHQGGRVQCRSRRRRPCDQRRTHRLRLFRRHRVAGARRSRGGGAQHRSQRRVRRASCVGADADRASLRTDRSDRVARREREDRIAAGTRCACATHRPARQRSHDPTRGEFRDSSGGCDGRHDVRRHSSAGAPRRERDRGAERPPRTGLFGRRRAPRSQLVHGRRSSRRVRRRSGAHRTRQPRCDSRARRTDDGRARPGLARCVVA